VLYFSKFRIILISLFTLIFVYLTSSNFIKFDDNWIDKKINLGLDLQGGSYLLLEIDNQPVIVQKLQNTVSILRKYFKDNNIFFKNLKIINDESIFFEIENSQIEQI
jgi:preprotein translocase subunit SecD/SecD/SecF fusion protein